MGKRVTEMWKGQPELKAMTALVGLKDELHRNAFNCRSLWERN